MRISHARTGLRTLAVGRITLSSSVLQFWDLGGQTDLRTIWPKYFADCHAVCYVIDSTDTARMDEVWSVFGASAQFLLAWIFGASTCSTRR